MLRTRLEQITRTSPIAEHGAHIAALAQECPHSIVALASLHPLPTYTCLVHALDFTGKPEYVNIAGRLFGPNVYAGKDFAHWLLDSGALTSVSEADASDGDLGFYFDNNSRFKHVGLLRAEGRVESKWGNQGLYEHAMFEIPESYGDHVRFFRRLAYEEAIQQFFQFAEQQGITI